MSLSLVGGGRPSLLVVGGGVLLGVGIGWHATAAAPLVSAGLALLALPLSRWRVEIFALAAVPLMLWLGLTWPLPALVAGALVGSFRWRRTGSAASIRAVPSLRPARLAAGTLVGLATAIAVLPLAVGRFSGSPLVFGVQRPAISVVLVAVLGASLLNAVSEEMLWRGVVSGVQVGLGQPVVLHVAVQAISFGLAHFRGIPGGWPGVAAAAGFGGVMAAVRLRVGLPAVIVAHAVTDVTIFSVAAGTAIYLPSV